MSLEHLTEEVFREHLDTTFRVNLGEQRAEFKLVEVVGDKSGLPKLEGVERFSIFLKGPGPLPQGTYALEHERLGSHDIFIVPVGREPDGFRYEAVFSRMTA